MTNTPRQRQRGSSIQRLETKSGPRWRFRVDLEPGQNGRRRQRTLTFKSENEAVAAQARLRTQIAMKTYIEPARVTVNEYLDDWLAVGERNWRPTTYQSYRLALGPARAAFGTKPIQKVTRADVEALVRRMLTTGGRHGNGRAPRTVALLLTILNKAFKDAVDDDLLQRNVVERVTKPHSQPKEMKTWDAAQVRTFLDHVEDDPLVGLWHLTMRGLRRGEVLGLRWGDVDFDARVVHVRQARVQAGPEVVTGPPKTARGTRSIPLDIAALRALRLTRERTLGAGVVPLRQRGSTGLDDRLVAVDQVGEPLRPEVYSDMFTRHARAAELPRIRLHDARHSALSILLDEGIPAHVVARFAGHDPSITMRTYAHVSDAAAQAAAEVFERTFGTR